MRVKIIDNFITLASDVSQLNTPHPSPPHLQHFSTSVSFRPHQLRQHNTISAVSPFTIDAALFLPHYVNSLKYIQFTL